jgi:hypothetical protein
MSCVGRLQTARAADRDRDVPPIFWTTESWKILVLAVQARRRIFHEEITVQ